MATDTELKSLPAYITHYLRKVIGVKFPVLDNPQPSMTFPPDQRLYIPLSKESLEVFLSPEFVQAASPELLLSIVIGLCYHEVAHALSGEVKVEPHILNNLICDANDFTFIPETWKGSIPFTLTVTNAFYAQTPDLTTIALYTKAEKLTAILHLAVCFMRKRRVKYEDSDVRSLPEDHPLYCCFERVKPIVKRARRVPVDERPKLVQELYEVVKDLWEENRDEREENLDTVLGKVESMMQKQRLSLSAEDARKLNTNQHQGTLRGILEEIQRQVDQEAVGNAGSGTGTFRDMPFTLEEETEEALCSAPVDKRTVSELRQILRPLLFERSYRRRAPSIEGDKLNPGRFYEIKTNSSEPKIRKKMLRNQKALDEVELILCFDRSGSMESDGKSSVAVEIAATLYKALSTISKARVQLLAFDDVPHLIKGNAPLSVDTALRRIAAGVKANGIGGTNLPLGTRIR